MAWRIFQIWNRWVVFIFITKPYIIGNSVLEPNFIVLWLILLQLAFNGVDALSQDTFIWDNYCFIERLIFSSKLRIQKIVTSSIGTPFLSRFVLNFQSQTTIECNRSMSRSKTSSFVFLDAKSQYRLKSLQTCCIYLLGLRRPVKVRIEIILLSLKDIEGWIRLLVESDVSDVCSCNVHFFYLWTCGLFW